MYTCREQLELKSCLITTDDFDWTLEPAAGRGGLLRLIGGVDISFADEPSTAGGESMHAARGRRIIGRPHLPREMT